MESRLSMPPVPPAALHSASLISGILERVAIASDVGELATVLRTPMVPAAEVTMAPLPLEAAVVSSALGVPARPALGAWAAVHRAILQDAHSARPLHARQKWLLGLAAAAAVAISTVIAYQPTSREITVTFTDLDVAPGIDFTLLRHGIPR
jgi:hypothetical protein